MKRRLEALLQILLFLAVVPGTALAETLYYEASYQGLFSAGQPLKIAAISLETGPLEQDLIQSVMRVTSEPYAFVEKHYPFRVRYRSIWSSRAPGVRAMEIYEKTHKIKHEIVWVDREEGRMQRYRPRGKHAGQHVFPVSLRRWLAPGEEFQFHKYGRHPVPRGIQDWLSMLQAVRAGRLETGAVQKYVTTDGKHLYHYRVKVEGRNRLEVDGQQRWTWKLRFDATEEGKKGAAHRPVYVWLSDDERHQPLQFESRHPLGRFTIRLSAAAASAFQ